MTNDVQKDMQRSVAKIDRTAVRFRIGEVTDDDPLSVALGGASTSYTSVRSIAPVKTGDRVAVLMLRNDLLVLGRIDDGSPHVIFDEVTTEDTITGASYAALSVTVGPSITIPSDGVYIIEAGFGGMGSAAGAAVSMSYDIGGTGAVDADRVYFETQTINQRMVNGSRARRKTLTAGTVLTAKYKVSSGTGTIRERWLRATRA